MDDALRITSSEFEKDVGRYQEIARSRPVVVTREDRDQTVMISADEYERLKRRDRRVYGPGELPDRLLEAIRVAEVDPKYAHLDELIKDWNP